MNSRRFIVAQCRPIALRPRVGSIFVTECTGSVQRHAAAAKALPPAIPPYCPSATNGCFRAFVDEEALDPTDWIIEGIIRLRRFEWM